MLAERHSQCSGDGCDAVSVPTRCCTPLSIAQAVAVEVPLKKRPLSQSERRAMTTVVPPSPSDSYLYLGTDRYSGSIFSVLSFQPQDPTETSGHDSIAQLPFHPQRAPSLTRSGPAWDLNFIHRDHQKCLQVRSSRSLSSRF